MPQTGSSGDDGRRLQSEFAHIASCTSRRSLLLLLTPLQSVIGRESRVEGVFLAFHLRLVGGGFTSAAAALWLNMNSSCTEINFASQQIDFSLIKTC
jgi:hypothetical protein